MENFSDSYNSEKLQQQKLAALELEFLRLEAEELKKKNQTMWQQVKHILTRPILVAIILTYSLIFGSMGANGPLDRKSVV